MEVQALLSVPRQRLKWISCGKAAGYPAFSGILHPETAAQKTFNSVVVIYVGLGHPGTRTHTKNLPFKPKTAAFLSAQSNSNERHAKSLPLVDLTAYAEPSLRCVPKAGWLILFAEPYQRKEQVLGSINIIQGHSPKGTALDYVN